MAIRACADMQAYPVRDGVRDVVEYDVSIPIGASGAVGTVDAPLPEITVTKTGDGEYDVVVPPCLKLRVYPGLVSADATPTTLAVIVTDVVATSGTFKIQILATIAGGSIEPESGTVVNLLVRAYTGR